MSDWEKPIGNGGIWAKEGKSGKKYLFWSMEFPVNANVPIVVYGVAFKNEKKEDNQPDYKIIVNGWKHPEERKPKVQESKNEDQEGDIPF